MTNYDQKKLLNKTKHDLEGWREIILCGNSILKWDKKFYPAIIFVLISTFFLLLWYLDFSSLTLSALLFLCFALADYIFPIVSKIMFKQENWTDAHENKFEEICNELCSVQIKIFSWYDYMFTVKEEKSAMFLIITSVTLVVLAWIGAVIDNLLLAYITTLAIGFYPGLYHHGFIGTVKGKFGNVISSKLQQLKEKANKSE